MTVRLVSKSTNARFVLVLFHLTAELDQTIKGAVGPNVTIVNATGAPFSGYYAAIKDINSIFSAAGLLPIHDESTLVLAGFSEGCQAVRSLLRAGLRPRAVVAADGTHAGWPVDEGSVIPWRDAFERAAVEDSPYIFAASHSGLTYVERLKPPQNAYASTLSVLRKVTGWDLTIPDDGGTHISTAGNAAIWSCAGADAPAHIRQGREVLPDMLEWVASHFEAVQLDESVSLGQRCVEWSLSKVGVSESPPGSNSGPEISLWLSECVRGDNNQKLGITKGNWCAAFASAALEACLSPGDERPHMRRCSVAELMADAMACHAWVPIDLVRLGEYTPEPGDLACYDRSDPTKPETSWYKHVNRVVAWHGETYDAVGGNENNAVRTSEQRADNPKLLGFITYHPDVAVTDAVSAAEAEHIMAEVAISLDDIARSLSGNPPSE